MTERAIVYILKNGWKAPPDELRHSLRSLQNFPEGPVVFAGGQPEGFEPDIRIPQEQQGRDRFEKVLGTLRAVCESPEIGQEFWLFNDDFFILKPAPETFEFYRGTLANHITAQYKLHGFRSEYCQMLQRTKDALAEHGLPVRDYTLHLPMLINKEIALEAIQDAPAGIGFRSWYGNHANPEGAKRIRDVKISNQAGEPDPAWTFCSTSNIAFATGAAGRVIRAMFQEPSRWEVRP